jgi:phospholipase/carboxylesterase
MDMTSPNEDLYLAAALQAARAAHDFLEAMEAVGEQLAPERSARLAAGIENAHGEIIRTVAQQLAGNPPPESLEPFAKRLQEGWNDVERAYELFTSFPQSPPPQRIPMILGSMHHLARAQETFYLLRRPLTPFKGFWDHPDAARHQDQPARDEEGQAPTGVIHVTRGGFHGGFSLYVPEYYSAETEWPVIVALHGGSGNGRDFLWTWVREAKSYGYLLVAPSAAGDTWGDTDDQGLLQILTWLSRQYRLAENRILLTGLSDGATFGLLYGLAHPTVYRAIAPLCGVLHPANEIIGNLERAKGMPIYLVHGALDFLFPVQLARQARDTLAAAGAALEYRELPDLSHTYPRSENVRILRWFEGLPTRITADD